MSAPVLHNYNIMDTVKYKKRNNLTKNGKGWWYYRLCWGTGVNHREKIIPLKTKDKSVANCLGKKVDAIADGVRNGIYSKEQIRGCCRG